METIIYQGQPIAATLVNYISGHFTTSTVDRAGDETLFRDEEGRYYLRRRLNWLRVNKETAIGEKQASGRTHVHRINVNAAILWATTRLNSETLDLCCDAAALLMENRGYVDPNPVHLSASQRAMVSDPDRFARQREPASDSGTVTVPLTLPTALYRQILALGAYDERESFSETVVTSMEGDIKAWVEDTESDPNPAKFLATYLKEHPLKTIPAVDCPTFRLDDRASALLPGRITVELDDLASAMLRKTCKEGDPCRHAGENLHDLVNAAVTFYLCNEQQGEFDLSCGDQALQRAKHDRLRLEGAMPTPAVADAGQVSELAVVEAEPGVHCFTFDYPATERYCGMQRTVELSDEQMERARELAALFRLDLMAFLRGLVNRNTLPGQPRCSDAKAADLLQAEHLGFVCTEAPLAKRIERAAQSRGQSVDEFVAYSLGSEVDMWEENMLLHPTTGDLLDTDYEDLYSTVEEKMIVPPTGREDEAQFRMSMGKERVTFSVYLRPEQMERLEYPHFVTDCETGVDHAFALIPLDPEGSPYLSVGKRELKPGESIPCLEAAPGPQRLVEQKGVA